MTDARGAPLAEWDSGSVVTGRAVGLLFLAIFGAFWALTGVGISGLAGLARTVIWVGIALITAALCIAGLRLIRAARALPRNAAQPFRPGKNRLNRSFGLIFAAEFAAIFVAAKLLTVLGQDALVLPVIALIVGVHFLPLGRLFHVGLYYATGGALIVAGCAGLAGTLASGAVGVWTASVASASALVLWATATVSLRQARHLLRGRPSEGL